MSVVEIRTPAKINLTLDVLAKRSDGYHDIESLMIKVGLYDELRIHSAQPGEISLTCDHPDVPTDERNLVHQAAVHLARRLGPVPGCRIQLTKNIPVGGGMGGGSSNAAGALQALNRLWHGNLAEGELAEIGAALGSDVPFFFAGPCAIVSGRGERVRPVSLSFAGWAVLLFGGVHVSTARVYGCCTPQSPESSREKLSAMITADRADALRAGLRNGLEPAVFQISPEVHALYARVRAASGRELRVSGAGSVLFDLFDTEAEARRFAEALRRVGLSQELRIVRAPVSD